MSLDSHAHAGHADPVAHAAPREERGSFLFAVVIGLLLGGVAGRLLLLLGAR